MDTKLQSRRCFLGFTAFSLFALVLPEQLPAATGKGAEVTKVTRDIRVIEPGAKPRPAVVHEKIASGSALETGADSWIELKFADESLARLGARTKFAFKDAGRRMELQQGATVLQTLKGARDARIEGAGVAAAVKGTTVMFECYPTVYKFLVLEGTARIYRPGRWGSSVLVRPGQMVIGKPNTPLSDPVDFDIGRFLKTSRFLIDFAPLRSAPLMARAAAKQERQKSKKRLIETNLVIFGSGTAVSLTQTEQPVPTSESPEAAGPTPAQIPRGMGSAVVDRMETIKKPE